MEFELDDDEPTGAPEDDPTARLATAVQRASIQGVRGALDAGADPAGKDPHQDIPIIVLAAWWSNAEIVGLLLDRRPDQLDRRDDRGINPLKAAVLQGRVDVVELLLARGAVRDEPLLVAACGNALAAERARVLELLIEAEDVNARDERGLTALHHAALSGYSDIARFLLIHGADPAGAGGGRTPLDLALHNGRPITAQLLIAVGQDVEPFAALTIAGRIALASALHFASAGANVPGFVVALFLTGQPAGTLVAKMFTSLLTLPASLAVMPLLFVPPARQALLPTLAMVDTYYWPMDQLSRSLTAPEPDPAYDLFGTAATPRGEVAARAARVSLRPASKAPLLVLAGGGVLTLLALFALFFLIVTVRAFGTYRSDAIETEAFLGLKQLAEGTMDYCSAQGRLPDAAAAPGPAPDDEPHERDYASNPAFSELGFRPMQPSYYVFAIERSGDEALLTARTGLSGLENLSVRCTADCHCEGVETLY